MQADRGLKRGAESTALKLIPRSEPAIFQELHYEYMHPVPLAIKKGKWCIFTYKKKISEG